MLLMFDYLLSMQARLCADLLRQELPNRNAVTRTPSPPIKSCPTKSP